MQMAEQRISFLKDKYSEGSYKFRTFLSKKVFCKLKEIHHNYVLTVADKAQGNIIITCKNHYLSCLSKEVDSSPTYSVCELSEIPNIQDKINKYCTSHRISVDDDDKARFPYFYSNPKMHKNPTGNRFLCASSRCSTKSLLCILVLCLKKLLQAYVITVKPFLILLGSMLCGSSITM